MAARLAIEGAGAIDAGGFTLPKINILHRRRNAGGLDTNAAGVANTSATGVMEAGKKKRIVRGGHSHVVVGNGLLAAGAAGAVVLGLIAFGSGGGGPKSGEGQPTPTTASSSASPNAAAEKYYSQCAGALDKKGYGQVWSEHGGPPEEFWTVYDNTQATGQQLQADCGPYTPGKKVSWTIRRYDNRKPHGDQLGGTSPRAAHIRELLHGQ